MLSYNLSPETLFLLQKIDLYPNLLTATELEEALEMIQIAKTLTIPEKDVLMSLFELGPLGDWGISSPSDRDLLIAKGLAVRMIWRKREGFTACTYKGARVLKILS